MYLGQHDAGLRAGMDIIPILRAGLLGMINAVDLSGLAAATLIYNIADEADFLLGVMVPWGKNPRVISPLPDLAVELGSELGAMPLTVFLESRLYF